MFIRLIKKCNPKNDKIKDVKYYNQWFIDHTFQKKHLNTSHFYIALLIGLIYDCPCFLGNILVKRLAKSHIYVKNTLEENAVSFFSSMASKPINVHWIRTGSKPY